MAVAEAWAEGGSDDAMRAFGMTDDDLAAIYAAAATAVTALTMALTPIAALVNDVPIVQHPAQFFHRPVEEGLFLRRQRRLRVRQQLFPVGIAAEQFAVPPHLQAVGMAAAVQLVVGQQHLRDHPGALRALAADDGCIRHGSVSLGRIAQRPVRAGECLEIQAHHKGWILIQLGAGELPLLVAVSLGSQ